jgi:hypothetical protein
VLFPCNSHTYLCSSFVYRNYYCFSPFFRYPFPLQHLPYPFTHSIQHFISSTFYSFHQFQPPSYFFKFLITSVTFSVLSSSTSTLLIYLFPFLINSLDSSVFSNLSKYSLHVSAFPLHSLPFLLLCS